MGGHAYWYTVKYQPDVDAALQELRAREFAAGRYNPVMPFINFPIGPNSPAPGTQHATYEEAMEESDADGTRSIIDITHVGNEPDFSTAYPLTDAELEEFFGTARPTRQQVEASPDFGEAVERGHCVYIVLYKDDVPDEIYFFGYSFD